MLTVTDIARRMLVQTLRQLTDDPEKAMRVVSSGTSPEHLDLILDTEREGDVVIEDADGARALLIGSDMIGPLDGKIVDYRETPSGPGFIIADVDPEDREPEPA
jgi:Fe-S cluster assembly iron-binding protein IscA